ncbi:MAG: DUF5017 domain-containing protein [Paludibacteraceae bacterium]
MKRYKFILTTIIVCAGLIACEDAMKQKIDFDVRVAPAYYLVVTDTSIIAPVGSRITFNFEGEPDFISFAYERFLPTNATLKFATQAAWGSHIENTLQVLVSDTFEELSYKLIYDSVDSVYVPTSDFNKDSIAVSTHHWTDVTAQCNLPTVANQKHEAVVPINDYRGRKLVIAFRYKAEFAADWQPSWIVSDLVIDNSHIMNGTNVSSYVAATMGFTPFDMLNRANAYRNEYVSGVWNTSDPTAMQIRQTARNNALNEDWLISKPIEVPLGLTENSIPKGVKNTTISVGSYSHTFNNIGEYVVTFKASNYNYKFHDSSTKSIKLIITE